MRRLAAIALASALAVAIARPAQAQLAWTIPGSYRSMVLTTPGTSLEARGAYVPVLWFGGPTRFFRARLDGGGAYLQDGQGRAYSYAVVQASANFELPLGPVSPYLGVMGHAAYPFQQPSDVSGFPYGVMPQVGVALNLGFATLDVHAGRGPVWGLSRPGTGPYDTTMTDIGGRIEIGY